MIILGSHCSGDQTPALTTGSCEHAKKSELAGGKKEVDLLSNHLLNETLYRQ